jgi:hypothetical protein
MLAFTSAARAAEKLEQFRKDNSMQGNQCDKCGGDFTKEMIQNDNWPENIAFSKCSCGEIYFLIRKDETKTIATFQLSGCFKSVKN